MSKRRIQVVILAEDKRHRTFVERLLKQFSYKDKLRSLPLPAGRGSGEQYVRRQYPLEVQDLRGPSSHLKRALVVVLDADSREVADRHGQLADQLKSAGLEPRTAADRIVHLIPRRNIETWIAYLVGQQVNETDTYPRLTGRERDCQPAVDRFMELYSSYRSDQQLPADCPPSLVTALDELRRLA